MFEFQFSKLVILWVEKKTNFRRRESFFSAGSQAGYDCEIRKTRSLKNLTLKNSSRHGMAFKQGYDGWERLPATAFTGYRPLPATDLHRLPAFTGYRPSPVTGLHRLPAFTGYRPSPVTGLHRLPAFTGYRPSPVTGPSPVSGLHRVPGLHRLPAFTGYRPSPVTGLHRLTAFTGIPATGATAFTGFPATGNGLHRLSGYRLHGLHRPPTTGSFARKSCPQSRIGVSNPLQKK